MSPSIDEPAHVIEHLHVRVRGLDLGREGEHRRVIGEVDRVGGVPGAAAGRPRAPRDRRRCGRPAPARAPRRSSSRATSAPMPLAAPVMTLVLPRTSSRRILLLSPFVCRRHSILADSPSARGRYPRVRGGARMGKTSDAVAEGVSIASAAARLTVRNHILVETIAHDESFDVDRLAPFAQETLVALADGAGSGGRARAASSASGVGQVHRLRRHARLPRPRHAQPPQAREAVPPRREGAAQSARPIPRRCASSSSRRGMPRGATSRRTCSAACASRACDPTSTPTTT